MAPDPMAGQRRGIGAAGKLTRLDDSVGTRRVSRDRMRAEVNERADVPRVSAIIPVFNEEASLPELRTLIEDALGEVAGGYEVVFVDDGSTDGSGETIAECALRDVRVVLVQLSRNFGMDIAMSAGLDYAAGSYIVLMHADLQDPPELIPEMLQTAQAGVDVVYARRIGREESAVKRVLATGFCAMMGRLARVPYQG
jgi:glycosyltransferase involved in cell wall biosynthesis